jgi:nitroreductase
MDVPVETWYPAIFRRSSRRTYLPKIPDAKTLERLRTVTSEYRPFPGARSELVLSPPENIFKGLVGHYGRVNGAPFYIAFIGENDSRRAQEAIGYLGEGIILEATALGLDTCWVGGFFRHDAVEEQIKLSEIERVFAVTPVGYAPENKDLNEKILSGIVKSRQRKSLAELVSGPLTAPWMGKALEAVRQAPSAQNRQPWRFRIEESAIVVSEDRARSSSSISTRLDCGIAMLHLELGAHASGVIGRWEFLESPDVAAFVF